MCVLCVYIGPQQRARALARLPPVHPCAPCAAALAVAWLRGASKLRPGTFALRADARPRWITCFVSVLPLDEAAALWDTMLTHGMRTLVSFTASLLALVFKTHPVQDTSA